MGERASVVHVGRARAGIRRRSQPVRPVTREVLAAVIELSERYYAPSTSLITWRLARGGTVTAAFQSAVRDALQRLRADGQLSCVTHRGTQRWSATGDTERPSA